MFNTQTLYTIAHYLDRGIANDTPYFGKIREEVLTFTTKEEYLTWVAFWKHEYKRLTQESRAAKRCRKASQPNYDPFAAGKVFALRSQARAMLWIRAEGRKRSWELKQQLATSST